MSAKVDPIGIIDRSRLVRLVGASGIARADAGKGISTAGVCIVSECNASPMAARSRLADSHATTLSETASSRVAR